MRLVLPLGVVAALCLAPVTAVAHPGVDDSTGSFKAEADGLAVTLQSDHLVQKAQRLITFNVSVYTNGSGRYELAPAMDLEVEAAGPAQATVATERNGDGHETRILFPAPGEWLLMVHVNGTVRSFPMHVYPLTDFRLEVGDFRSNFHYAHMPVRETAWIIHEKTGAILNATKPGTARVLPESGTGAPLVVPLEPSEYGGLVFEHTFDKEARYFVSIASPEHGFGYDDLPAVSLTIGPPFPGWSARESPGVGPLAMLGLVALLALVARTRSGRT